VLDFLDERLHAVEVALREEIQKSSPVRESGDTANAEKREPETVIRAPWQLAGGPHKRHRRGISSSAFDLRFNRAVAKGEGG